MVGSASVPNLKRTGQRMQRSAAGHASSKAMRMLMPGVAKSKDEREAQLGWREREEQEQRDRNRRLRKKTSQAILKKSFEVVEESKDQG